MKVSMILSKEKEIRKSWREKKRIKCEIKLQNRMFKHNENLNKQNFKR